MAKVTRSRCTQILLVPDVPNCQSLSFICIREDGGKRTLVRVTCGTLIGLNVCVAFVEALITASDSDTVVTGEVPPEAPPESVLFVRRHRGLTSAGTAPGSSARA